MRRPEGFSSSKSQSMSGFVDSLQALLYIDGAIAAALVDSSSGKVLDRAGGGIDFDLAASGNAEVVRAQTTSKTPLNKTGETVDDILIVLGKQYHIIRPLSRKPHLFVYLVLDRAKANLALARVRAEEIVRSAET